MESPEHTQKILHVSKALNFILKLVGSAMIRHLSQKGLLASIWNMDSGSQETKVRKLRTVEDVMVTPAGNTDTEKQFI